jgi:16S rRNA (cytidine1402-2'-O)-methyltransferase
LRGISSCYHINVTPSSGTLWLVATPIGTLGDFSPRAREVLQVADLIFAEDTRRARKLLSHVGVAGGRRLRSLHEHNEAERLRTALEVMAAGGSVVVMSDAGTPVLSDPGFLLVRAARRGGHGVASVPGPSSFTAALAASGQPPLPAMLVGFLPGRACARRRRIGELSAVPSTLVVLLSPHRLGAELGDLAVGLGEDRPATLLVEISKVHERALMATLGGLVACDEVVNPRGEYVVVVGPPATAEPAKAVDRDRVRRAYSAAVADGKTRKQAMKEVAARLGVDRRAVFDCLINHEKD